MLTFLFAWHKQFWKWKKTPKQYKVSMKLNTDQNNFLCYSTVWSLFLENFETSGFIPNRNKTYSEITICFVKKNVNPLIELLFANAGGSVQKESLGPTLRQLDKPQGIQGESLHSFHSSLHWKEKEIPSLCTGTLKYPQQETEIIFNYWELLTSKRLGVVEMLLYFKNTIIKKHHTVFWLCPIPAGMFLCLFYRKTQWDPSLLIIADLKKMSVCLALICISYSYATLQLPPLQRGLYK